MAFLRNLRARRRRRARLDVLIAELEGPRGRYFCQRCCDERPCLSATCPGSRARKAVSAGSGVRDIAWALMVERGESRV